MSEQRSNAYRIKYCDKEKENKFSGIKPEIIELTVKTGRYNID